MPVVKELLAYNYIPETFVISERINKEKRNSENFFNDPANKGIIFETNIYDIVQQDFLFLDEIFKEYVKLLDKYHEFEESDSNEEKIKAKILKAYARLHIALEITKETNEAIAALCSVYLIIAAKLFFLSPLYIGGLELKNQLKNLEHELKHAKNERNQVWIQLSINLIVEMINPLNKFGFAVKAAFSITQITIDNNLGPETTFSHDTLSAANTIISNFAEDIPEKNRALESIKLFYKKKGGSVIGLGSDLKEALITTEKIKRIIKAIDKTIQHYDKFYKSFEDCKDQLRQVLGETRAALDNFNNSIEKINISRDNLRFNN